MKSFKAIEANRRDYYGDSTRNSVHRASLTVPEIAGAEAEISFLNHFLLKRGYENVACRITAIDRDGQRIDAKLFPVTEPRVYSFALGDLFDKPAVSYVAEFFAAENLFIPFPAVMVNHRGPNFLNSVHAYNRVLNDVFEDDAINAHHQREASIDVRIDRTFDTFLLFSAGAQNVRDALAIELSTPAGTHAATVPLELPRLTTREVSLADTYPDLGPLHAGVLKVQQPRQALFYGRMLAGQRHRDGAWSANHSYYDSSDMAEYWEDASDSWRLYPLFPGLDTRVRMYPIMSPSRLGLTIALQDGRGRRIAEVSAGEIESPGDGILDLSIPALAQASGLDPADMSAFAVYAQPIGRQAPTRVNHQLVLGASGDDRLQASINVSMGNPNVFVPAEKIGLSWGQIPVGADLDTWLGLCAIDPAGGACPVEVAFYDSEGEIARRSWTVAAGAAIAVDVAAELEPEIGELPTDAPAYLWYTARGQRPDLTAYTVSRHRQSGHCSGEHSF